MCVQAVVPPAATAGAAAAAATSATSDGSGEIYRRDCILARPLKGRQRQWASHRGKRKTAGARAPLTEAGWFPK